MKRLFACLLVAAAVARAQDIPVRRAEPVKPAYSPESPVPVRRAEPAVPPPAPASTPAAQAVAPPPGASELRPSAVVALDPAVAALDQANGFYARKMHDMAVPKYAEFLQLRPVGGDRQVALFRMAEGLRELGRNEEAVAAYKEVASLYRTGEFMGPACYRLGEMQYSAGQFSDASDSFHLAAQYVRDPKLRLASKFFEGRSLDGANRKMEALSAYREVAAQAGDNPYRERAMFDLAEADAKAGLTDSAFRQFRKIAETAQSPPIRTGAAVKAGLLAIDVRDFAAARPLLEAAASKKELPAWAQAAQVGLVRLDYESGHYADAAKRAETILPALEKEVRPDVLLLGANARRQLGQQAEALALYDRLAAEFPQSDAARDSGFHRLVCLADGKDERALPQIDIFLMSSASTTDRAKASLLKAELLFAQNKFAEAGPLYEKAAGDQGAEKYRADALFKLAWCQLQDRKYDLATRTLTKFLTQFPRNPQATVALVQRGLAQLETGQNEEALADFTEIVERHPDAPGREDALLQRALVLGNLKRFAEMSAAFERLLAEYPESKSAAQAKFWIGYTAFEAKKYRDAIKALEESRRIDPSKYGERAAMRLLLCHYYLEDRESAAREAESLGPDKVPAEVRTWLGMAALAAGDNARAAEFLRPLADAPDASDDLLLSLAQAQLGAGDCASARATAAKLLPRLHEPKIKARAHLLMSRALAGLGKGDEAKAQAEEALKLQPEGRLNAEARLANGRALLAQNRYDDAARAFMAVALLYDEKDLTPEALSRAEQAYRKAGAEADAQRAREELQRRYPEYKADRAAP